MHSFFNIEIDFFGLDISEAGLKLAKVEKRKNKISLVSLGSEPVNERCICRGKIENENVLTDTLEKLLGGVDGKKIKTKHVKLSLSEEKSFLKIIKMPKMKKGDLSSAIKYEAENHFPSPLNDFYLDFKVVSSINEGEKPISVLLVAMPKEIIEGYIAVLKKSNLVPILIETNPFSAVRALTKEDKEKESILFVDVRGDKKTFIIFFGGVVQFSSSIALNSNFLEENELSYTDAFSQEIQKHLDYHSENFSYGTDKIKKIIIFGDLSKEENLVENLSKKLKKDVSEGDPLSKIDDDLVPSVDKKLIYANVIGAALRGYKV